MAKEWDKLDEDCKISVPFDQYFLATNKLKKKEDNKSLYKNNDLNCAISKVPLPTFDGSSQSSANTWGAKIRCVFSAESDGGRKCLKNGHFALGRRCQ